MIPRRNKEPRGIAIMAIADRTAIIALRTLNIAVIRRCLETILIGAGDEVDHPGNRIGTVGCSRAILENLDPADRRRGDQIDVDNRNAAAARLDDPLAIQQHQRALRTKPAQIDRCHALITLCTGIELVGIADNPVRSRQVLEQLDYRRIALLGELFGPDHIDRRGCLFTRAADQCAGDHDLPFFCGPFFGWGCCLSQNRTCQPRQRQCEK